MEIPRERRMREIVNVTSPPVDFGSNPAPDAEDEQQGELAEAPEKRYLRALQEREKALGADHTLTLDTACSLGLFYSNHGKLAEAEQMYQWGLQGYEKTLGADHTSTLNTVYNLGLLCMNQGKLDEAQKMFRRALQGYEKVLGEFHTSTLDTVYNLGPLYLKQRSPFQALPMYNQALEGYEIALGRDHLQSRRVRAVIGNIHHKICLLPWYSFSTRSNIQAILYKPP
jgi:tetratricopeptide (TPR) repeat protein